MYDVHLRLGIYHRKQEAARIEKEVTEKQKVMNLACALTIRSKCRRKRPLCFVCRLLNLLDRWNWGVYPGKLCA